MKLEQLQHIIEIEKQKSISKAAKALYIGQPTLSGSLTSLEEEIGVKLFERTYSGVIPTEEGKEAVQLAKQALEAVNGIQNLGQSRKEITGTVTVLLGHVYNYLYNDILLQFHKRYPQAELKLLVRTHDEIINELLDGKADIGMVPVADEKFFSKGYGREAKNFRIEIFGNYKVKAFASPNSSYVNQTEISDVELQQEQLLTASEGWKNAIESLLKPDKPVLVVADNEAMKRMICAEEGIALVPEIYEKQIFPCNDGMVHVMRIQNNDVKKMFGVFIVKQRQSVLEEKTVHLLRELL